MVGFFLGAVAALFIYREMIEDKRPRPRSEASHDDLKRLDALDDLRKRLSGISPEKNGYSSLEMSSSGKKENDWLSGSWRNQKTFNNQTYDRIPEESAELKI